MRLGVLNIYFREMYGFSVLAFVSDAHNSAFFAIVVGDFGFQLEFFWSWLVFWNGETIVFAERE